MFQLIQGRSVRRITSEYKIFAEEWDKDNGRIILPPPLSPRYEYMASVKSGLQWQLDRLKRMLLESEMATGMVNLDEITADFSPCTDTHDSVFNFIRNQIRHKRQLGKVRSAPCSTASCTSATAGI